MWIACFNWAFVGSFAFICVVKGSSCSGDEEHADKNKRVIVSRIRIMRSW